MPTDGAQDKTEYVNPANLIKFCHFTSYYTTEGGPGVLLTIQCIPDCTLSFSAGTLGLWDRALQMEK